MTLYDKSKEIILNNQHENGAYIASPMFSQYGFSWLRDGAFIAFGMTKADEFYSAEKFFRWVEKVINRYETRIVEILEKPDEEISIKDFLPTRYTLDGYMNQDNWENAQSDGYGIYLWALGELVKKNGFDFDRKAVKLISDYLTKVWNKPCYDAWEEECNAIHTSTLFAIAAGLKSAEYLLGENTPWQEILNKVEKDFVKDGRFVKSTMNSEVDSNLIWACTPYELYTHDHPVMKKTADKIIKDLYFEGGVKRYSTDTYFGGGSWILLSASLANYFNLSGNDSEFVKIKVWIESHANLKFELPEQIPEHLIDIPMYQPWVDRWGEIACPLLWSHANYLVMLNK